MSEATRRPWVTDSRYPGAVYCDDATGSIVARTSGDGFQFAPRADSEREANAALIVHAVNQSDELTRLLYKADQLIIKLSQVVYKDAIADHLPCGLKDEVEEWLRVESAKVERP